MKNLKIYKNIENNKLKGNLSKNSLKITSGIMVLIMATSIFTGCDINNDFYSDEVGYEEYNNYLSEDEYYNQENNNFYSDGESNFGMAYENENYIELETLKKAISLEINLDKSDITNFKKFISNIKVDYKHSEYYNIDASLNEYNKINKKNNSVSNIVIRNNSVDANYLYNIILKNNAKYFSGNSGGSYYTKMDDSTIKTIVSYIAKTINYNMKNNKNIDLNALDYKLANLKICKFSDFGYAFYSQNDNTMAYNLEAFPTSLNSKISILEEITTHETNHMIQNYLIEKNSNVEQYFGMCYEFKNLDLNALFWNWFVESTAQNNTLNQTNLEISETSVYNSGVLALNLLNATSVLSKNNSNELSYLMSQGDVNKLFDYFGCKTQEDKKEIIKMMVAYNLIVDPSDMIYSSKFYNKVNISDTSIYEKELKGSIAQTNSKIFYNNIASLLENKTTKIEDIFSLISIFETTLSKSAWYASEENCNYMKPFYSNYEKIQNEFFEMLANSLNVSLDEVYNYYISYHNLFDQSELNNKLLNNKQNEFYTSIYLNSCSDKRETVYEIYNNKIKNNNLNY